MNRKQFTIATIPAWVLVAVVSNLPATFLTPILLTALTVYMLAGQMSRCTDIGIGVWPSTWTVLAVFLIGSVIGHFFPAAGFVIGYGFPLGLMFINSGTGWNNK